MNTTICGIDCREKDGTVYINLVALAKGLGYIRRTKVNGTSYCYVDFTRVNKYLSQIGITDCKNRHDYVKEEALDVLSRPVVKQEYKDFANSLRNALLDYHNNVKTQVNVLPINTPTHTFTNDDFGSIRVIDNDGEPWFVGKDIATALGYSNSRKALSDHIDNEDKGVTNCDTLGGQQAMTIINESGLYSLILSSKLPSAKKFKRWVTSEVLPSIRKHGAYMTSETLDEIKQNPESLVQLVKKLLDEQEKNKNLLAEIDSMKLLLAAAKDENESLGIMNKMLMSDEMDLDYRAVLNKLMRAISMTRFHYRTYNAWKKFYQDLKYKHHIDLKIRYGQRTKTNPHINMIDCIHDDEWPTVIKFAIAWCERQHLDVRNVLGKDIYDKNNN